MSSMQRRKGAAFEREVKEHFKAIYPDAERQGWLQVERICPDVLAGPFWLECKHQIRCNPQKALEQSSKSCPKGYIPVAVCKDNRREATITMWLSDGLDLIKEHKERGE